MQSPFYHNGSSLLVNFSSNGITNRATSIKASPKSSTEIGDKSNIIESGIMLMGSKTNKDVAFLEDVLWY
ncbi:hypothetical protein A8F94_24570 [Bacillus sp. FJAT-27225]|nr:hypothetical protein A8F94_24570 [Bacillus sp. FJAT-27225]